MRRWRFLFRDQTPLHVFTPCLIFKLSLFHTEKRGHSHPLQPTLTPLRHEQTITSPPASHYMKTGMRGQIHLQWTYSIASSTATPQLGCWPICNHHSPLPTLHTLLVAPKARTVIATRCLCSTAHGRTTYQHSRRRCNPCPQNTNPLFPVRPRLRSTSSATHPSFTSGNPIPTSTASCN